MISLDSYFIYIAALVKYIEIFIYTPNTGTNFTKSYQEFA